MRFIKSFPIFLASYHFGSVITVNAQALQPDSERSHAIELKSGQVKISQGDCTLTVPLPYTAPTELTDSMREELNTLEPCLSADSRFMNGQDLSSLLGNSLHSTIPIHGQSFERYNCMSKSKTNAGYSAAVGEFSDKMVKNRKRSAGVAIGSYEAPVSNNSKTAEDMCIRIADQSVKVWKIVLGEEAATDLVGISSDDSSSSSTDHSVPPPPTHDSSIQPPNPPPQIRGTRIQPPNPPPRSTRIQPPNPPALELPTRGTSTLSSNPPAPQPPNSGSHLSPPPPASPLKKSPSAPQPPPIASPKKWWQFWK